MIQHSKFTLIPISPAVTTDALPPDQLGTSEMPSLAESEADMENKSEMARPRIGGHDTDLILSLLHVLPFLGVNVVWGHRKEIAEVTLILNVASWRYPGNSTHCPVTFGPLTVQGSTIKRPCKQICMHA